MTAIAKEYPDYTNYICLPPTAPLRTVTHVEEALETHMRENADSTISVKSEYKSIWKYKSNGYATPLVERLKNRQEVEPVYICNGAIFITTGEMLRSQHRRMAGHVALYLMDEKSSLDIHNEDDLKLGEFLLQ